MVAPGAVTPESVLATAMVAAETYYGANRHLDAVSVRFLHGAYAYAGSGIVLAPDRCGCVGDRDDCKQARWTEQSYVDTTGIRMQDEIDIPGWLQLEEALLNVPLVVTVWPSVQSELLAPTVEVDALIEIDDIYRYHLQGLMRELSDVEIKMLGDNKAKERNDDLQGFIHGVLDPNEMQTDPDAGLICVSSDGVHFDALAMLQGSINYDLYAIVTSADPTGDIYPIISPCEIEVLGY